MSARHLRLFDGNASASQPESATETASSERVTVALGDMLPLLMQAAVKNHCWLDDLSEEQVEISKDFYEVLLVFRQLNQRRAA